jgi:hypothetical protein
MRCRHTVPDWHRYAASGEDVGPIFAACRLLVKEGEQARDPRSIACAYWGHQRDCPLYDGPGGRPETRRPELPGAAASDAAIGSEGVWPVRAPGTTDSQRVFLSVLAVSSMALLGWAVALGVTALNGRVLPTGYRLVILIGGVLSLVTHTLTLLRLWVRGQ